jgi:hypothetical protein
MFGSRRHLFVKARQDLGNACGESRDSRPRWGSGWGFDINRIRDLLNRLPIHTDSNQLINRYKSLLDMSNIIRLIHQISGVKMGLLINEFTKMLFIVRMYGREGRGCHVGRL